MNAHHISHEQLLQEAKEYAALVDAIMHRVPDNKPVEQVEGAPLCRYCGGRGNYHFKPTPPPSGDAPAQAQSSLRSCGTWNFSKLSEIPAWPATLEARPPLSTVRFADQDSLEQVQLLLQDPAHDDQYIFVMGVMPLADFLRIFGREPGGYSSAWAGHE